MKSQVKKRQTTRMGVSSFMVIFLTIFGLPSVAQADTVLCTGNSFSSCINAGYTAHGYENHYTTSYWNAFAGHNCTNYIGYMLTQNGDSGHGIAMGNGGQWDNAISTHPEWGYTMDGSPAVGSIAQWEPYAGQTGSAGHVAYVEVVSATSIIVSEDNYPSGPFRWRMINVGSQDWPTRFLHIKDIPQVVDSDGDTIPDNQDWCPQVSGLAINYGCPRPNSQQMAADFNKDGRSDIAAFFDYGGGNTALFTWSGQADGKFGAPDKKWQGISGWEGVRFIPIGTGDFDSDSNQDIASFFNYGAGELGLFVWYGNGNGSFAPASRAWHASSGWDGARIIPGGVGDFNQDGHTDVTAFFNYGGGQTALFTWNGQINRSFTSPVKRWEALSGWDARRLSTGVAGDFNGDGHQDVTAFFNYGGGSTGAFTWSGDGTGNLSLLPRSWFAANGWDGTRNIPAGASDFDNDGRSDIIAFFDYGGGNTTLFSWGGRADGLFDAPAKKWQAKSGWEGSELTPLGSADFNGSGTKDVSAFFDYGGSSTGAFLWNGSGSGSFSLLPRSWFASSGWESARIIPNR